MKREWLLLPLICSLATATNSLACGDKLVQVVRGIRYQRASAVRPANIVMFLSPNFDRHAASRLRSDLAFVGHKVQIVEDAASLVSILPTLPDIILTDVDNLPIVTEQVSSMSSKPTIIPIIDRSTQSAAASLQVRFPFVMTSAARGLDQIAMITRALK